ncbi:MAG: oligosaccharide flippase family protein [Acetatifactor sp.]|nr:oligosaccharide flippase family protein [Acetatifactor sp.]
MKKRFSLAGRPLIMGTFILTATGLVTRTIGFFYRIYLSRLFGEEGMGIYQLLSPVLALSFSLCAAAYQTAISKFVAEDTTRKGQRFRPLITGTCYLRSPLPPVLRIHL